METQIPAIAGRASAAGSCLISMAEWGEALDDAVVASAIVDRLMHIKGPSWRMREHHALETATSTSPR